MLSGLDCGARVGQAELASRSGMGRSQGAWSSTVFWKARKARPRQGKKIAAVRGDRANVTREPWKGQLAACLHNVMARVFAGREFVSLHDSTVDASRTHVTWHIQEPDPFPLLQDHPHVLRREQQ